MRAARALSLDGTLASSTGPIVQSPSCTLRAWELLNASMAQKMGSQRSRSDEARLARCAEFTTSTAWNLKPTGRGWMFRTPASMSAARISR